MWQHMLDEHHNKRSIWDGELVEHRISHLMIYIVHHIQLITYRRANIDGTLVSKGKKGNQVTADPIIVSSTWRNAIPKHANKGGIQRREASEGTSNAIRCKTWSKHNVLGWS